MKRYLSLLFYTLSLLLYSLFRRTSHVAHRTIFHRTSHLVQTRHALSLLLFLPSLLFAQESDDYYNPQQLQYENAVYRPTVKTVQLHRESSPTSEAVLRLQDDPESLLLSFDLLEEHAEILSYTIIHCKADWSGPSDLDPFDYIDGFNQDDIMHYEFSNRTKQDYVYYEQFIPGPRMRLTKSGNYLIKVFANGDLDEVILTRRFIVYENRVDINVDVLAVNALQLMNTHQRLNFAINYAGLGANRLLLASDFTVNVLQNGRWDNAIENLQPTTWQNNRLLFNSVQRQVFEAGNEFRYFDFRSLRQRSERVRGIEEVDDTNHLYVSLDKVRSKRGRSFRVGRRDLNGKFQIGIFDGLLSARDEDYAQVHFELEMEKPISFGNIYVFGALTDWQLKPEFQLHYNRQKKSYQTSAYLKQGYYDYMYVIKEDGNDKLITNIVEGNFFATENDYYLLVYYHPFDSRYARLVGIEVINTFR